MIEQFFDCPYCWQRISILLDPSELELDTIEDCEVCCRPIRFKVHLNLEGQVLDFSVFPPH